MKYTRYFEEQVLRKRPYIDRDACAAVVARPLHVDEDGRVRFWGQVVDARDGKSRILRVVTLEDRLTIHNAFYDRNFRRNEP